MFTLYLQIREDVSTRFIFWAALVSRSVSRFLVWWDVLQTEEKRETCEHEKPPKHLKVLYTKNIILKNVCICISSKGEDNDSE